MTNNTKMVTTNRDADNSDSVSDAGGSPGAPHSWERCCCQDLLGNKPGATAHPLQCAQAGRKKGARIDQCVLNNEKQEKCLLSGAPGREQLCGETSARQCGGSAQPPGWVKTSTIAARASCDSEGWREGGHPPSAGAGGVGSKQYFIRKSSSLCRAPPPQSWHPSPREPLTLHLPGYQSGLTASPHPSPIKLCLCTSCSPTSSPPFPCQPFYFLRQKHKMETAGKENTLPKMAEGEGGFAR